MENSGAWIRIEFNTNNQYEGAEELVRELKETCPVQSSTRWHASYCTGLELLLSLNFNLSLTAFLNNVIIPGAQFALTCAAVKSIWKIFENFYKKNQAIQIDRLEINFDDVTIIVEYVMSYGKLVKLCQEFPEHHKILESHGIMNICKIVLPYIENEGEDADRKPYRLWSLEDDDENEIYWRIVYERGLETCFYKPSQKVII